MPAPTTAIFLARGNRVPEHADSLDLELDDVARLEPTSAAELEDAAGADGARPDHVAREEARVERGAADDGVPRVVHVAEIAAGELLAVHARDHLELQVAEVVRRDDDRPQARPAILPLRRP